MFLWSFSVSFHPTLRYFLGIFLLLNFHKDTILPQACISWGSIFYSSIYTKQLEDKWKALSHMAMQTFFMFNPTSITKPLQADSTKLRFLLVPPEFAVGCAQLCLPEPLDGTGHLHTSEGIKPQHPTAPGACQWKTKAAPSLPKPWCCRAPQTELWEMGFFFISQLAYNLFHLQISLQNDTDRISYFFLWHLARLRRLLPQQVGELLIHGCGAVWDNCNFSSWHPGQGTK